jgi:hypothetical protein
MAARRAGLKIWLDVTDDDGGEVHISISVERPIPLPSDSREAE